MIAEDKDLPAEVLAVLEAGKALATQIQEAIDRDQDPKDPPWTDGPDVRREALFIWACAVATLRRVWGHHGGGDGARGIVLEYLTRHGYDGLCDSDGECACALDDLAPCGELSADCCPGHYAQCDCGDHDFHIVKDTVSP